MSAVEAFFEACRLPEAEAGQRVRLLGYHSAATKGTTHEVRLVPRKDQIEGFSLFFGSKRHCLQFMADNGLICVNLSGWGEQELPPPSLI